MRTPAPKAHHTNQPNDPTPSVNGTPWEPLVQSGALGARVTIKERLDECSDRLRQQYRDNQDGG